MIDLPPPIVRVERPGTAIVEMIPGVVRCGGEFVAPVRLERPFPAGSRVPAGPDGAARLGLATLSFEIDQAGRPLSIALERGAVGNPFLGLAAADVAPALAVSRFPAARRVNCRISYTPRVTPLDYADMALAAEFASLPWNQPAGQPPRQPFAPPGTTCAASPAKPRSIAFPVFESLPVPVGGWLHAALLYDVSAGGVAENVRSVGGPGSAELEAEARRALGESRFAPEAKTGCLAMFAVPSRTSTAPPPAPDNAAFGALSGACDGALEEIPEVEFPANFRKRSVEGWAVIRYSVAPWGQVGDVEVVASQPAEDFGDSARRLMLRATGRKQDSGRTGCYQRVRFEMTDSATSPRVFLRGTD